MKGMLDGDIGSLVSNISCRNEIC